MISDEDDTISVMLQNADFPDNYINMEHPEDFIPIDHPVTELIFHKRKFHNRLILRISFKIDENTFVPISFVCDTGAPSFLYLAEKTKHVLMCRISEDDLQNSIINIHGKQMLVSDPPQNHKNVNIMGLRALEYFELYLKQGLFEFSNLYEYL